MVRYVRSSLAILALLPGTVPAPASAANLAPIAISLVVQESCAIQSEAGARLSIAPHVSCLHGAPSGVTLMPFDPAHNPLALQPVVQTDQPAVWTVSF